MQEPRPRLAAVVVRLVAVWLLLGAGYKLFAGSPNDLPPVVRSFFLGPSLTFRLAIAIELSIAFLALIRPQLGWAPLALQMVVFVAILVQLIATGATSCGCFGSKVTMPPATMLAIDGTGLAAMLIARPWRPGNGRRPNWVLIGAAILVAWVTPFALVEESTRQVANVDDVTGEWKLPDEHAGFAMLDPETWVGKPLSETQLAVWMDVSRYDQNAQWVLYSEVCDHCAAFLKQREAEWVQDPKVYVLVKVTHATEDNPAHVTVKPPGEEAELPADVEFVMTPPWELTVSDGVVVDAVFRGDEES